jgi:hypothetical protein
MTDMEMKLVFDQFRSRLDSYGLDIRNLGGEIKGSFGKVHARLDEILKAEGEAHYDFNTRLTKLECDKGVTGKLRVFFGRAFLVLMGASASVLVGWLFSL